MLDIRESVYCCKEINCKECQDMDKCYNECFPKQENQPLSFEDIGDMDEIFELLDVNSDVSKKLSSDLNNERQNWRHKI